MAKIKYLISGIEFRTKQEITEYAQSILHGYGVGNVLTGKDFEFIYDLLQRHPKVDEKMGCGVKEFRIMKGLFDTRAFEIVRTDGTTTDFSYVKCISSKNELHDIRMACREAVRDDTLGFKQNYFDAEADVNMMVECPLTGEKVAWEDAHVDHMPPDTFDSIFRQWLDKGEIDPKSVEIGGYEDGEMGKYFKDSDLKERFREFHNQCAKLRVTSAFGNLSVSKKRSKGN